MTGVFGKANANNPTGKGGVDQTVNVPPFLSTGGITPEQQTLAQYSLGQDLLAQGNLFGQSGTGQSTMATQGAEGAQSTMAQQQGLMSDTDQSAQYKLYQNDVQALEDQLKVASALNTAGDTTFSSDLGSLAKIAGFGSSIAK